MAPRSGDRLHQPSLGAFSVWSVCYESKESASLASFAPSAACVPARWLRRVTVAFHGLVVYVMGDAGDGLRLSPAFLWVLGRLSSLLLLTG